MAACWCRLTQPENSRRKKASGGGSRPMTGACLSGSRRATGASSAAPSQWGEIPEANAFSDGVDRPVFRRSALGQVFAQDAVETFSDNKDVIIRTAASATSDHPAARLHPGRVSVG
jgi:hypothetical protein